ncbi:LysR family transcriptional regulator [Terasakiella sp.]|uniref:LysR family transcriptional regulator n=1 Tax=Terasakiella sp. TaxID=2034861 RepID=UPI003AA96496
MSIRALKTLIAIDKYGSFAAASEKLGLTQAAVSLQIKKLEDEFQTEIFDRSGHKPRLNTKGQTLLKEARQIVAQYDRLKGLLHQNESFSGPLIIGSINTVQAAPLPIVIREIQDSHPNLQISIKTGLSAELTQAVEAGQLDFAITTAPQIILPTTMIWRPYFDERFFVLAPKDFAEETPAGLLSNHPYVCFDRQAWAGQMVEQRLKQDGIVTQDGMELDSLEATIKMAQASLGVAVVSLPDHRAQKLTQTMKVVPFSDPPLYRSLGLMHKKESPWRHIIDTFFQSLQHHTAAPNLNYF